MLAYADNPLDTNSWTESINHLQSHKDVGC